MTADKVVDASAIAAILFNEPKQAVIVSRLDSSVLFAPQHIDVEVASVCLKKLRLRPAEREGILRQYSNYLGIEIHRVPVAFDEAILLGERLRLTAYDACYLWLAQNLRAELVTLDAKLERAATT